MNSLPSPTHTHTHTHNSDREFLNEAWQLDGDGGGSEEIGCPSPTFTFVHLHGALMYAAWGLLLPLGALLGRYYRWTWPCWFIFHVICQVSRISMGRGKG